MHVVFTLPRRLAPLVLQNKKILYDLLFRTSAETLLEVARDPRLLGAELGFFSVLHTWSQQLRIHPHVHCVIPAGGLSPDHTRWIRSREKYFLPKEVLREVRSFQPHLDQMQRRSVDDPTSHRLHRLRPSPNRRRVGPCIVIFEACSAFTHVTACMLTESPTRPSTPKASAASLPPPLLRLLPGGTNQFPGGISLSR
jgi:Putative transposase